MIKKIFFLFQSVCFFCYAQIDIKGIVANYHTGVVKILLYDPVLVQEFHLKPEQGYISRGSGFFVTGQGLAFTNAHVIDFCVKGYLVLDWEDEKGEMHQADFIAYTPGIENDPAVRRIYYSGHAYPVVQVFAQDDSRAYTLYKAEVLATSNSFDGAVLQIKSKLDNSSVDGAPFQALPLGNSDEILLGEDFVVLGYPSQYLAGKFHDELRDTLTLTYGKHSGWDYVFDNDNGLIKTDASINEGHSGGAVFGESGKVIGLATAMGAKTRIGLIGGINNMYGIISLYPDLLEQVASSGLRPPKKLGKVDAVMGTKKPIPTFLPTPSSKQAFELHPLKGKSAWELRIDAVFDLSSEPQRSR